MVYISIQKFRLNPEIEAPWLWPFQVTSTSISILSELSVFDRYQPRMAAIVKERTILGILPWNCRLSLFY